MNKTQELFANINDSMKNKAFRTHYATKAKQSKADKKDMEETGDYSPRSKLEEISKSYNAESTVLRPKTIDFDAAVMRLTDNDERLRD